MTDQAIEHLSAEDVARFLDAYTSTEMLACEPLEGHLRSCPQCRGRVVETRLLESHLQRAFSREAMPVSEADVLRARSLWSATTVPVLLPLPRGAFAGAMVEPQPGTSAPHLAPILPPPRPRRWVPARLVAAWQRIAAFVRRPIPIPLGAVAAGVLVVLIAMAASRAASSAGADAQHPLAIPGVVVTSEHLAPPAPLAVVETTLAPGVRVWMRRGALDDSAWSGSMHRAIAAAERHVAGGIDVTPTGLLRRAAPEAGEPPSEVQPRRRNSSPSTAVARRRALSRDEYDRLTAISRQLSPPLRAAFLGCVVSQARPDRSCATTIARAQAIVNRARSAATWPPESAAIAPDEADDLWVSVWNDLHRRVAVDTPPRR